MGLRKYLSSDGLIKIVQNSILKEKYPDLKNPVYSWKDCIMSGLAVFGLKQPSLLQFDKACEEDIVKHNLKTLYC